MVMDTRKKLGGDQKSVNHISAFINGTTHRLLAFPKPAVPTRRNLPRPFKCVSQLRLRNIGFIWFTIAIHL